MFALCEAGGGVAGDFVGFVVDFYGDEGFAGEQADEAAVLADGGGEIVAC